MPRRAMRSGPPAIRSRRPRPRRPRRHPPRSPPPVDLGRRRFFRSFAGELLQTAASVAGAAQALQQVSAEAASAILNPAGFAAAAAADRGDPGAHLGDGRPSGFRTPFREDGGVLYLIDQRRLPDALVEDPCKSAGEVAFAIREMVVRGAPAIGQVAAIGMALSAEHQRDGMPYARRATLAGRGQRPDQRAPDRGQPALGGRADDGPLRRGRRPVRGRRRDRRRDAGRGGRDRLRGDDRPRPAGDVRARRPAPARRPAASGSSPTATPGRSPAASSGRRSASSRPPTTPGATDPRLGRRDPAVPPGRAADGLGAGPGRRAAHADPRRGRRAT